MGVEAKPFRKSPVNGFYVPVLLFFSLIFVPFTGGVVDVRPDEGLSEEGGFGSEETSPLAELPDFPPMPIYRNVTEEAGLGDFLHAGYLGPGNLFDPKALFMEYTGPGACWLDFDGDGWLDLYLVNSRYLSDPEKNDRDPHSMLFRNDGDGTFTDVTQAADARTEGILQGCAAADYTNNGYPDLYITGWGGGHLLRNDGGAFTDVTEQAGVRNLDCGEYVCWGASAVWFDADLDGCLDLYVTNFTEYDIDDPPPVNGPGPGQYNRFYQNNCDGTFTDRTLEVGLRDVKSDSWSAVAADLNNDGWPDIYVSNDGDENDVYFNNGDGTFTRDPDNDANDPFSGMGTAVADFDQDARHDLVTTNFISQTNGIYQSIGDGYWDIGANPPFDDADPYSGWAAHWFDMDNDGLLDLMVFNGMTSDEGVVEPKQPVLAYRNIDASGAFESTRGIMGPDIDGAWVARGGAWADYDNDGAVDFLLAETGEAPTHLFNAYGVGNRFINVDVRSFEPGVTRDAVGARVTVSAPGLSAQMQEKVAGTGYMSSSDPRLHFGLGEEPTADVTVQWPGGGEETFTDLRPNTFVRITQNEGLEVLRVLPLVDLQGPEDPVQRMDSVVFEVDAEPDEARTIIGYEWHFGSGEPVPGGPVETHAFDDVGLFTVRVTVTDSEGDRRSAWTQIVVEDDLQAEIVMDKDTFFLDEDPTGKVSVSFSDGDPVDDALVMILIERTTGVAELDELMGNLPVALKQLLGWVPIEIEGRTGPDGEFSFVVPENVEQLVGAVPNPNDHHPGLYRLIATGGARGSDFNATETVYGVVVPPL